MGSETKKCARCEGCGQVADSESGEPWTAWASLPPGADIAVRMGIVRPVPCPACKGGASSDEHGAPADMATNETTCPDCPAPSWSGCAYGRCEGCEIDAGCDRESDCRQQKTVAELERSAPELVEAVVAATHTTHCVARQTWGDGECECAPARDRKAADYDRLAGEVERLTRERDEARESALELAIDENSVCLSCGHIGDDWECRIDISDERNAVCPKCGSGDVDDVEDALRRLAAAYTAKEERSIDFLVEKTRREDAEARAEALEALARRLVREWMPDMDCEVEPMTEAEAEAALESLAIIPPAKTGLPAWWRPEYQTDATLAACVREGLSPERIIGELFSRKRDLTIELVEARTRHPALAATPPADLTQHPAYRAGVEAGIEKAASVVDDTLLDEAIGRDGLNEIAATIRALLDTKEVRDGEG